MDSRLFHWKRKEGKERERKENRLERRERERAVGLTSFCREWEKLSVQDCHYPEPAASLSPTESPHNSQQVFIIKDIIDMNTYCTAVDW